MSLHTLARRSAAPAAVAVLALAVVGIAAPASAHVTVTASSTAAGSFAVLTVSVPHGCDGSATTSIDIQMPEQVNAVTPTRNPLYQVEKTMQQLDPPVTDAHGNEITERVETVTYTAEEPLPEGYRDSFELSLQIPEAEGTTLVFPVVQTCEEGESAWIQVPEEGQSADELELPAPSFTITAAEGDGHGDAVADDHEAAEESEAADEAEDSSSMGAWGLGAGALGVVLGGAALLQGRRRS